MRLFHKLKTLAALCLFAATAQAQTRTELHRYDETNSALEGHLTQMLQDRDGLLWIATWNGLCRFDGYEFRQLKPQPGDGCSIPSDRIRNIWLSDDGDIYLRVDDDTCRFDTRTYRFCDLSGEAERLQAEASLRHQPTRAKRKDNYFYYQDPQGLEWQIRDDALYCLRETAQPVESLPMEREAMVRYIRRDSRGRIWLSTKDDATVRLLDGKGGDLGYLSAQGIVAARYQSFGHPVYCITETRSGHIWLGCKPGGLYRLTETKAPSGYSLQGSPLFVGSLPVKADGDADDCYTLSVTASDGSVFRLPKAGGPGFGYLPLAMLLCAASIFIIIKKSKSKGVSE